MFGLDAEMWVKLISGVAVAIVGALVKHRLEGRAQLVAYIVHSSAIPVHVSANQIAPTLRAPWRERIAGLLGTTPQIAASPPPPTQIIVTHTHALVVRNVGKKTAHNVRVAHARFPPGFSIHPPQNHQLNFFGQAAELIIPTLVAQEQITISYLYFPPTLWSDVIGPVKCDEGMAKSINVSVSTPWPRGVRWLIWAMAFIGATSALAWLFWLLTRVWEAASIA